MQKIVAIPSIDVPPCADEDCAIRRSTYAPEYPKWDKSHLHGNFFAVEWNYHQAPRWTYI
jgi:hypothetical protein